MSHNRLRSNSRDMLPQRTMVRLPMALRGGGNEMDIVKMLDEELCKIKSENSLMRNEPVNDKAQKFSLGAVSMDSVKTLQPYCKINSSDSIIPSTYAQINNKSTWCMDDKTKKLCSMEETLPMCIETKRPKMESDLVRTENIENSGVMHINEPSMIQNHEINCFCGEKFETYGQCKAHYAETHESRESKHECLLCNQVFAEKLKLTEHMANRHYIRIKTEEIVNLESHCLIEQPELTNFKKADYQNKTQFSEVCNNIPCDADRKRIATDPWKENKIKSSVLQCEGRSLDLSQPNRDLALHKEPNSKLVVHHQLPSSLIVGTKKENSFTPHISNMKYEGPFQERTSTPRANPIEFNSEIVRTNDTNCTTTININDICNSAHKGTSGLWSDNFLSSNTNIFENKSAPNYENDNTHADTGSHLNCFNTFSQPRPNRLIKSASDTSMSFEFSNILKTQKRMTDLKPSSSSMKINLNVARKEYEGIHEQRSSRLFILKNNKGGGTCQKCGLQYQHYSTCKTHYIEKHGETSVKNYFCLLCQEGFTFELNLKNHLKKVHSINDKLYPTNEKDGMLAKTQNGGGVCLKCGNQYKHFSTCKTHYTDNHEKVITIGEETATGRAPKRTNLASTQDVLVEDGSLEERMVGIPSILPRETVSDVIHYAIADDICDFSTNEEQYLCTLCTPAIKFLTSSSYDEHHVRVHSDKNAYLCCVLCQNKFFDEQEMIDHLGRVHDIGGKLDVVIGMEGTVAKKTNGESVCIQCGQTFKRISNCVDHINEKHKELSDEMRSAKGSVDSFVDIEQISDNECSNNLGWMVPDSEECMLTNEEQSDTEIEEISILEESTPRGLMSKSIPANTYSVFGQSLGENSQFAKNFIWKNRSNPIETHVDSDKLYVKRTDNGGGLCLVCHATFTHINNCRVHFRAKHGETGQANYNCLLCEETFTYNQNLKNHLKTKHGIKDVLRRASDSGIGRMMAKTDNGGGVCLECGAQYRQFNNLSVHFKNKHLEGARRFSMHM